MDVWYTVVLLLVYTTFSAAIPDINNPSLEGALDETGYDVITRVTNQMCPDKKNPEMAKVLIKPTDPHQRARMFCGDDPDLKQMVMVTNHVTMVNMDVDNMHLLIYGGIVLTFINCTFTNTDIWSRSLQSGHLMFVNTVFQGHINSTCLGEPRCRSTSSIDAYAPNVTISLTNCSFYQTFVHIRAGVCDKLNIENCLWDTHQEVGPMHRGIEIQVNTTTSGKHVQYNIVNTVVQNQLFRDPVISAVNIYHAAVTVDVAVKGLITVSFRDCIFRDNERAVQLQRNPKAVEFINCSFSGNQAMSSGPTILSTVDPDTQVKVRDCRFRDNIAGSFKLHRKLPDDESVTVDKTHINLNTSCCIGSIQLVAKGGAIALESGQMTVKNSVFINNRASAVGSAIYSNHDTSLTLDGVVLRNERGQVARNEIIFSLGNLTIRNTSILRDVTGYSSMMSHFGHTWSLKIYDIFIKCAPGFDVNLVNDSKHIQKPFDGVQRSYAVDKMVAWCSGCPSGSSSQDSGYVNYSVGNPDLDFDKLHYTMLWKMNIPPQFTHEDYLCLMNGGEGVCRTGGYLDHHHIQCKKNEVSNVERPSDKYYWKHETDSGWIFLDCPAGYCASIVKGDIVCTLGRKGTLCGEISDGYTPLYASSRCVKKSDCNPALFWISYLLMPLVSVGYCLLLAWVTLWVTNQSSRSGEDQRVTFSGQGVEMDTVPENDTAQLTDIDTQGDGENSGLPMLDVIIITVNFCQDAILFSNANKGGVYSAEDYKLTNLFISFFTRMDWTIFGRLGDLCVGGGASVLMNHTLAFLEVPKVVFMLAIFVIVWHFVTQVKMSNNSNASLERTRLIGQILCFALFLSLLINFQSHAIQITGLLKCVYYQPIESHVLYIDGSVLCTQSWQYALYLYFGLCFAPFILFLLIGTRIFCREQISETKFVLLGLAPLPAAIYWLVQILIDKVRGIVPLSNADKNPNVMANFLQNSLKNVPVHFEYFSSYGVVLTFRLTLVLVCTYNDDVIKGMLAMLVVVFLKQIYTLLASPYSSPRSNRLAVVGDAVLLVVGGLNLAIGLLVRTDGTSRKFKTSVKPLTTIAEVLTLAVLVVCVITLIINVIRSKLRK